MMPEDFLAFERESETKHEFYDGQIFAMAGTSAAHNVICMNLARMVGNGVLGKPCRTFGMDLRVHVSPNGFFTYPDLIVVCGEPVYFDTAFDTLVNPKVIVEVLSPSTEAYDRGRKFALYEEIVSLTDYLLVSQDMARVEHFEREDAAHWRRSAYASLEQTVSIRSIDCGLPMSEIYRLVEFEDRVPLRKQVDEGGEGPASSGRSSTSERAYSAAE